MEKRTPHYSLALVRRLILQGEFRITRSATASAANDFGLLAPDELTTYVLALRETEFYKAMTTINDARIWQDVYRSKVDGVEAYVKIQVVNRTTVLISFKRWGKS